MYARTHSKARARKAARDFWERARKRLHSSPTMTRGLSTCMNRYADDRSGVHGSATLTIHSNTHTDMQESHTVPRQSNGPKRPRPCTQSDPNGSKRSRTVKSASHSTHAVGSARSVRALRSERRDSSETVSPESSSTNANIISIKRAKISTASTAAAKGIVLFLGPKLAGKFPSASDNTA